MTVAIRVFMYEPLLGVPNVSPFCCKLLAWLRMSGLEYEVAPHVVDARRSPTKTIPWIEDDGAAIGDTSLIIDHLVRTRGVDLDADLTRDQRALALVVQRTLEEHSKWVTAYRYFVADRGWDVIKVTVASVPALFRPLVGSVFIRGRLRKQLWAHGLGRLDPSRRMRQGCDDWTAISTLLGDKPWLLGDKPHTIDASLYGFLAGAVKIPIDDDLRRHVLGLPNLVAYVDRATATWFPELDAAKPRALPVSSAA